MRRFAAEFVGTAGLLAVVVGSGIMGERLAAGNDAVALLANSLATGAGLVALILAFGSVSGAHFNPLVSFVEAASGRLAWRTAAACSVVQAGGAVAGVVVANLMFGLPAVLVSAKARGGAGTWLAEIVATFGLLVVIAGCARSRAEAVPYAVGAYITAAYWFTSSTSFANPAVTIARALSDTFAGIHPQSVAPFILAQAAGAVLAVAFSRFCFAEAPTPRA